MTSMSLLFLTSLVASAIGDTSPSLTTPAISNVTDATPNLPSTPLPNLTGPPPGRLDPAVPAYVPDSKIPPYAQFDDLSDVTGVAQTLAAKHHLQARIMWIDAGANVGSLNSASKIHDIVAKIKAAGFNMIVLDVKPIVGETVYPSRFAPRLLSWKGQNADPNLDVLADMLAEAHAVSIPVYANMSTFGEGHKLVGRGLAYTHPSWQTVLYEVNRFVTVDGVRRAISALDSFPPATGGISALTNASLIHANRPGATVVILNLDARVMRIVDGTQLDQVKPVIPTRGFALVAQGIDRQTLSQIKIGDILTLEAVAKFVPIIDAPEQVYTMFCNPINQEVRQHERDIAREIVTNYPVDGIVFDDRLRYAGLNADFGADSRAAFEAVVGKRLVWPDDVFKTSIYPGQDVVQGRYYPQWIAWRANNITSWVKNTAAMVRRIRPSAQVAVYVGSWYGEYDKVGSNWAATDFAPEGVKTTDAYRKTGYANQLDWITTGCYYPTSTIAEANAEGVGLGASVEAAGQLSNRVVNDAAFTYAGLYALNFKSHPNRFAHAITAATKSTQGVMVFDMSQIVEYNWWGVISGAFATPTLMSPSSVPGFLQQVRDQHQADVGAGKTQPPLPPYIGVSGIGL